MDPVPFNCAPPTSVFVKINNCCSITQSIPACQDIGDSLTTINFNFANLDAHTCNLELSAETLWNPAYSIFAQNSAAWLSVLQTIQAASACWQSAATTVKQMSAAWLAPISVVYPEPFPPGSPTNVATITTWVQTNFPVIGTPAVDGCPSLNYVDGQRLWVFSPEYTSATQLLSESSSTPCSFVRAQVRVWMRTINYGQRQIEGPDTWLTVGEKAYANANNPNAHWNAHATLLDGECSIGQTTIDGEYTDKFIGGYGGLEFVVAGGAWAYSRALSGY